MARLARRDVVDPTKTQILHCTRFPPFRGMRDVRTFVAKIRTLVTPLNTAVAGCCVDWSFSQAFLGSIA